MSIDDGNHIPSKTWLPLLICDQVLQLDPLPPELIGNSKSILSSPDDFSFPIVPKAWPGTM